MHAVPSYLNLTMNRHLTCTMARFRLGVSQLIVHVDRYKDINGSKSFCLLCKEEMENEVHFLLTCPALHYLREQYIPKKYYSRPSLFRAVLLLSNAHPQLVKNVAIFLYRAFKTREILCS